MRGSRSLLGEWERRSGALRVDPCRARAPRDPGPTPPPVSAPALPHRTATTNARASRSSHDTNYRKRSTSRLLKELKHSLSLANLTLDGYSFVAVRFSPHFCDGKWGLMKPAVSGLRAKLNRTPSQTRSAVDTGTVSLRSPSPTYARNAPAKFV
jgi:hypothetical protein